MLIGNKSSKTSELRVNRLTRELCKSTWHDDDDDDHDDDDDDENCLRLP